MSLSFEEKKLLPVPSAASHGPPAALPSSASAHSACPLPAAASLSPDQDMAASLPASSQTPKAPLSVLGPRTVCGCGSLHCLPLAPDPGSLVAASRSLLTPPCLPSHMSVLSCPSTLSVLSCLSALSVHPGCQPCALFGPCLVLWLVPKKSDTLMTKWLPC